MSFDARAFTEEVLGGPPVEVGKYYLHPEDGIIQINSGQWWGDRGLSNFWYWTVVATGEEKHGYAGPWVEAVEITDLVAMIIVSYRK